MTDRQLLDVINVHELRKKVTWLFFGTRNYDALDDDSKEVVDDIINDGYERFLRPPALPGEKEPYTWKFLRPILSLTTVADQDDYSVPENLGSIEGNLFFQRSDNKWWPITKTDPTRILMLRQRDPSTITSYPTEYAIISKTSSGGAPAAQLLMLWPTPDAAYSLKGRYFIVANKLSDSQPYPACDPYHNQCLLEAVLAVAEERLEDQQAIHNTNFMYRLQSSVAHDREKYSADHLGTDRDHSDHAYDPWEHYSEGSYVAYNGYTPGV